MRETAKAVGVSHTTIVNLANDVRGPSAKMCGRLARVFDVPTDTVLVMAEILPSPRVDMLPEMVDLNRRVMALEERRRTAVLRALDAAVRAVELR